MHESRVLCPSFLCAIGKSANTYAASFHSGSSSIRYSHSRDQLLELRSPCRVALAISRIVNLEEQLPRFVPSAARQEQ